jgi:phytanoyl-CoA hydroxylase
MWEETDEKEKLLPFILMFCKFRITKRDIKINDFSSSVLRQSWKRLSILNSIQGGLLMSEYPLTEEQIQFYESNGYIKLENVISLQEVEDLRAAIAVAVADRKRRDAVAGPLQDPNYEKIFLQMVNLWEMYPQIKKYVFNERIAQIACKLSRSEYVRLWHDHALIKQPRDSGATAWHQDLPYWPMKQTTALSCWMALDDVTVENGCMHFIPGSHKFGRLEPIQLANPQDIFELVPEGLRRDVKPIPIELNAGSCTFHNGLTFHYAGPNKTDKPRRAMVTIYIPAGVTYMPVPHVVGDRAHLREGEQFEHDLFPILAHK